MYGFYAGNDARIGATLPATTEAMKAAGKKFEPVTYDGAGHGFMRAGEDPTDTVPGNKTAREQGFARLVKLISEVGGAPAAGTRKVGRCAGEDGVGGWMVIVTREADFLNESNCRFLDSRWSLGMTNAGIMA